MQNPRLASRYAKSLLEIAIEQNALDAILEDMRSLQHITKSNHDLVLMLRSPVIKGDKKMSILKAVLEGKVQPLTVAFIDLLTKKGREFYLPEMTEAFINQYKAHKNIKTVQLTTAVAIDDQLKEAISKKVSASLKDGSLDLHTVVDESIIGGFKLEIGDKLFDASVRRDLVDIKNQFTKNIYVADI
jgi:F-type H+-transporting ATPase subunit delta